MSANNKSFDGQIWKMQAHIWPIWTIRCEVISLLSHRMFYYIRNTSKSFDATWLLL